MADSNRVQPVSSKPQTSNRWGIALARVIMQIALGAVYAWSVFRIPLTKGLMLTAWGFAGVLGPTLIARIRQSSGHYTQALHMISILVLLGAILPLITRPPRAEQAEAEKRLEAA